MVAHVLFIGHSDASAGTGIQADLKTAQAYDVYGSSVITAVNAQNTTGVFATHIIPGDIVSAQLTAVINDIKPQVIKTGMLATTENIQVVADLFDACCAQGQGQGQAQENGNDLKIIVDPVMTSRSSIESGHEYLDKEARDIMKRSMLLHADILTPNIQEAQELTGMTINTVDDMCHAADMLRTLGPRVVIVKGGALPPQGKTVCDVLADDFGTQVFANQRRMTRATHGAGSTLSAGLAACLAKGMDTREGFGLVRRYLDRAIATADDIGQGCGPLNHNISVPYNADYNNAEV